MKEDDKRKVVYLIGAGASHACVRFVGGDRGILMDDLTDPILEEIHSLVRYRRGRYKNLAPLINDLANKPVDLEQVITFLDQSPSAIHRELAEELRKRFEKVLRARLREIEESLGKRRFDLYAALLDMYEVEKCPEELQAILTINYDEYIEAAALEIKGTPVDFGVALQGQRSGLGGVKLLKLHGSFGWWDAWPIRRTGRRTRVRSLWMPPGIQKAKERYPFNALWGLARELLDCDVLRVIGCRLGSNDWDLISLLFTTRHANDRRRKPYAVEIIDSPDRAFWLQEKFPYLDVQSILEIETMGVGKNLVGEYLLGSQEPTVFRSLGTEDQQLVRSQIGDSRNWFRLWLEQMAEAFESEPGLGVATKKGAFAAMLEG